MQRTIARGALFLCAVGFLAAAATPASAAGPPPGTDWPRSGLTTATASGRSTWSDQAVTRPLRSTRPPASTSTLLSLDITGTFDGNPFDFSKTYGQKSGLTTFTCTQHFEADQGLLTSHWLSVWFLRGSRGIPVEASPRRGVEGLGILRLHRVRNHRGAGHTSRGARRLGCRLAGSGIGGRTLEGGRTLRGHARQSSKANVDDVRGGDDV